MADNTFDPIKSVDTAPQNAVLSPRGNFDYGVPDGRHEGPDALSLTNAGGSSDTHPTPTAEPGAVREEDERNSLSMWSSSQASLGASSNPTDESVSVKTVRSVVSWRSRVNHGSIFTMRRLAQKLSRARGTDGTDPAVRLERPGESSRGENRGGDRLGHQDTAQYILQEPAAAPLAALRFDQLFSSNAARPPAGRYLIYNRVLSPSGQKLAITYNGERTPPTAKPLTLLSSQVWVVRDYDSRTQSISPDMDPIREAAWGAGFVTVLPPHLYVWTIRRTDDGFTIQDGGVTVYWGLDAATDGHQINIGQGKGDTGQLWVFEKLQ